MAQIKSEAAYRAALKRIDELLPLTGDNVPADDPNMLEMDMLCDMVDGYLKAVGPNVVGLTRRGFSREVIQALKEAFRFIYRDGLNRTQALERVENDVEQFDEIKELVAFYRNSTRGVC